MERHCGTVTITDPSLKVSEDGAAHLLFFLDFNHHLGVLKPQRFGSWFYFHLQVMVLPGLASLKSGPGLSLARPGAQID
jgi:hypothetical protein